MEQLEEFSQHRSTTALFDDSATISGDRTIVTRTAQAKPRTYWAAELQDACQLDEPSVLSDGEELELADLTVPYGGSTEPLGHEHSKEAF